VDPEGCRSPLSEAGRTLKQNTIYEVNLPSLNKC